MDVLVVILLLAVCLLLFLYIARDIARRKKTPRSVKSQMDDADRKTAQALDLD